MEVLLVNASYGIGALSSPLLISFFELKVYYIIAVLFTMIWMSCLIFPNPVEVIARNAAETEEKPKKIASLKLMILLTTGLFMLCGV